MVGISPFGLDFDWKENRSSRFRKALVPFRVQDDISRKRPNPVLWQHPQG
jgi:hypothetical protein